MANKAQEEAQLTRYLLGKLSEPEREPLEAEYFADDEAFEQLLITEEELIEAYACGELSGEQSAQFEAVFLKSRQGRERLYFARDLFSIVSDARRDETTREVKRRSQLPLRTYLRGQRTAFRFVLAAAGLIIVVGLPWLLVERARMVGELRQMHIERAELFKKMQELERQSSNEHTRIEGLLAQLESERARSPRRESGASPPSSPITFVLSPGLVRGGIGKTLILPQNTSSVVLCLNVEVGAYVSYRARIETTAGREVWLADSVKPPRRAASVGIIVLPLLPAEILPPGDFILFLSGKRTDGEFESVADYPFRIVRE